MGCTTIVELGPGQVLTGLVRRTLPDARALAAGNPEALAAAARAKGQKAAARSVPMQVPDEPLPPIVSLEDCNVVASWIVRHLADGSLDPRVAREMTAAIAQKRHVLGSIREMERRLKEYKKRLAALEKAAETRG